MSKKNLFSPNPKPKAPDPPQPAPQAEETPLPVAATIVETVAFELKSIAEMRRKVEETVREKTVLENRLREALEHTAEIEGLLGKARQKVEMSAEDEDTLFQSFCQISFDRRSDGRRVIYLQGQRSARGLKGRFGSFAELLAYLRS